jgi:hypothetical protein
MAHAEDSTVKRRTVYYIEGYDPRGPSHYHTLYRDEAEKQSARNGLKLAVGPRRKIGRYSSGWSVTSPATETTYVFLRYDDLMRARWSKTNLQVLREIGYFTWLFMRQGVFAGMYRHSRLMLFFALSAPSLVVMSVLLSAGAAFMAAAHVHAAIAASIGVAILAGLLALRPRVENRVPAFWLARICAFIADQGNARAADMEARIDAFAAEISAAVRDPLVDEVLVVGHSVGSHVGVSVCSRVLDQTASSGQGLSFLTLGQTIPLLGLQPGAEPFRSELARAAAETRLDWVDFTAPMDGLCFPLTDPLLACGLAQPDPSSPKPLLLSARYVKLFTPATYRKIKRDFYRLHFQYLMATELPGDYDYFLITAGDKTLAQRYLHTAGAHGHARFRTNRQ